MKATNHFCHYHQPFLSTLPNSFSTDGEEGDVTDYPINPVGKENLSFMKFTDAANPVQKAF